MKVKSVGIKLISKSDDFNSDSFYDFLVSKSGFAVDSDTGAYKRVFYFSSESEGKYLVGLVITLKDQKRYCRAEQSSGDFVIKREDLQGDDKLVDFNFFVIRKDTGKGVFQYYHNSCSPNALGDFCKKRFYEEKEEKIKLKYEELSDGSPYPQDKKAHKKAKKVYRGRPYFSILLDSRDAASIIAGFREVNEVTVTYDASSPIIEDGVPATKLANSITHKFKFGPKDMVGEISSAVKNLTERNGFLRGKAKVHDSDGEERMIDLMRCPQDFGQDDFDDLVLKVDNLKAADFSKNGIVGELKNILQSKEHAKTFATSDKE